jgi:hypothetical protein
MMVDEAMKMETPTRTEIRYHKDEILCMENYSKYWSSLYEILEDKKTYTEKEIFGILISLRVNGKIV